MVRRAGWKKIPRDISCCSPDEAQRNPGTTERYGEMGGRRKVLYRNNRVWLLLARISVNEFPDCATLHPGYIR